MLNNFYKIIHTKYSKFFEFIFFLRYLLIIFFISIATFLTVPFFFNYEKKAEVIKLHLLENYDFKISNYSEIKYNIFPLPNLELSNVQINFKLPLENLRVKNLKIYLNLFSIYNYENFNSKKIILRDSDIKFQISSFKSLLNQLFHKKNKLYYDHLNLIMIKEEIPVIALNNIKFANFGYKKNLIKGKVFGKNFKVTLDENYENINFKLINSGINIDLNFERNQKNKNKIGTLKSKILNTNFKSNFEFDGKVIKIYNSYYRSKNLSFRKKSEIILKPFLEIKSEFTIEELKTKIFREIDLTEILKFKDFLRKINIKSTISFKSKKFDRKFFDDLNLRINLAYGRVNYSKRLLIGNASTQCDGDINFLEEYPLLYFDCNLNTDNKGEFLKKLSVRTKNKNEILELKVKGNLNVLNKKVNFKSILMNENYRSSKEDLEYFKSTFENILFNESLLEIFNLKKIKRFITEIS